MNRLKQIVYGIQLRIMDGRIRNRKLVTNNPYLFDLDVKENFQYGIPDKKLNDLKGKRNNLLIKLNPI